MCFQSNILSARGYKKPYRNFEEDLEIRPKNISSKRNMPIAERYLSALSNTTEFIYYPVIVDHNIHRLVGF
jgi:hypothetical protein